MGLNVVEYSLFMVEGTTPFRQRRPFLQGDIDSWIGLQRTARRNGV